MPLSLTSSAGKKAAGSSHNERQNMNCRSRINTTMSANDLLLNYHDAVIYRSDLALLDSQTDWLNDACINFQMTRLRQAATTTQEKVTDPNRQGKGTDVVEILEDLFLDP